jgi:valyl-tRNA synthetase
MEKHYDAQTAEPKWQEHWEKHKINAFDRQSKKPIYSIDTPPPTVSGRMHLGHSFSYAQQDFIARYKKMAGFNVFYPFGTDGNGLPTQLLIERTKKVRAVEMGREKFRKFCMQTLDKEIRPDFIKDWKKLGMSCDFEILYKTIEDHARKISQKSFIDLYKIGREYRKEAPAMWCPKCQTAISQVECQDAELSSHFNDIVFKVDDQELLIATTRPELLPACVAVFYHPQDTRYKNLNGKKATVPLFDFEVPIMEDERADPEKGTGIVMCCTFGDTTDMEWQKAHNLPIKAAITKDGKMTELAGKYQGMKMKQARKQMIMDMQETGLLKNQKPISHTVNVHERCGTEIEYIHSKQWFIKYLDLKEDMIKWGRELKWYPDHMRHRYENWVNGLQWDWCISRQIYFGIPFPVWYCGDCDEILIAREDDLPVDPLTDKPPAETCPKCSSEKIIPEKDIINTWATSSLSPQIAAALVPEMYDKLYPMSMRPQAHDIITFWLFNTVVKSQMHNNVNPWKDCVISGWALDPKGKKMSKSKGNVIDPEKMMQKYSADCLRFWAAGSKLGEDLPFQEKDLVTGKKMVTKLWNASKFALMHIGEYDNTKPQKLHPTDIWLLSKLNYLVHNCTQTFDKYEYSKAKQDTENFFWNVFCDYYLEIIKDRLYNPDKRGEEQRQSAQYTLYTTLLTLLKLIAPIMPHITEEIYHQHFIKHEKHKSIHHNDWPNYDKEITDPEIVEAGDIMIEIIAKVRKHKTDNKLSLAAPVKKLTIEKEKEKKLDPFLDELQASTKSECIEFAKEFKIKIE